MRAAAIIILYHPTEQFISNLLSYYDYVERVFVYDNTETDSGIKNSLANLSKVIFHQDFQNDGISKRLNMGCEAAIKENFDWVLTMDQDSIFAGNGAAYFFSCCEAYPNNEKIALFGCNYGREEIASTKKCEPEEISEIITSGMVINLNLYKIIGQFDEALYIDSLDHEYCVRTQLAGFKIINFSNIQLLHEVGTEVYRGSLKSLFLIKKKKIIHSSLRCYYMYRNMLYLENKYKSIDKSFTKILRKHVITHLKICFLYGRDSLNLYRYIKKAAYDYEHNKMGKIDHPL